MAKIILVTILLMGLLGSVSMQPVPMVGANGLADALRQLPSDVVELLNQILMSVGNLLSSGSVGNGVNQQSLNGLLGPITSALQQGRLPDLNRALQGLGVPNLNLPNLNDLTAPVTDALRQGRLPDLNQATQGITNGVSGLTDNLSRTLNNILSGARNNGNSNPLSSLLGGLQG